MTLSRVTKVASTLRNNWKKSVFFSLAGSYGISLALKKREETLLMRTLCKEARRYGQVLQPLSAPLYNVTVILNPAASGGGAKKKFEQYCAPILHLAGMHVFRETTGF